MTTPAIDISHFTKRYNGNTAVNDLTLQVQPNEFFGFLGRNGAGKSTTIHAMTGIARLTEGAIRLNGIDVVSDYREARKQVGLSPQEFTVDPFIKVKHLLDHVAGFYGMPKSVRQQRIAELFEQFDLGQYADTQFRKLSGGFKRRVMFARALVHDPDILILDEPTAGVDVELRHELWEHLQKLNAAGKTIFLTSHYLEEVEYLCNRIGIIHEGNLIAVGDKEEFTEGGKTLEKRYLELTQQHDVATKTRL